MAWFRNLLISLGAFWFSLEIGVLITIPLAMLNNGRIYHDGVLDAIAEGLMTSMGMALGAVLAATLVMLAVLSLKPQRWAFLVAVLYVTRAHGRHHWVVPPSARDRLWMGVDLLWPAIACLATTAVITRLRRKSKEAMKDQNG